MRVMVVVSLLVVTLAGCSEDPKPLVVEEPEEPVVVTDPSDYSYNTTRQHLHDYWNDQWALDVFQKTVPVGAIKSTEYHDVVVRGGTDQVIPQGARWVNVTLDWSLADPALHAETELWLMTARSPEPFRVQAVAPGDTVTFESDNGHNDLPHQRLSAWRFLLRFHGDGDGFAVLQGELNVTVTAARGLDIPLYPGHPDQWHGATELPLLSFSGGVGFTAGPVPEPASGRACLSDCLEMHRPDDGAIVPYNASVVEVVLRETGGTGGTGAMLPGLMFHGADTLEWTRLEPDEASGSERIYRIPVEPGVGDSAYAQQSLWEFQTVVDEPQPDGVFVGSYDLDARVLRTA